MKDPTAPTTHGVVPMTDRAAATSDPAGATNLGTGPVSDGAGPVTDRAGDRVGPAGPSRCLPLLALLLVVRAAPVAAQEAQPDSIVAVPVTPITVTVLRTPFQVSEVPYAVTAVGKAQIQRARPGISLDEALRGVPGVQVDNRYNYALGERISIRGFGARAQFGVRGVKVLVDGIPATLPDGQTTLNHVDLASLGRVEVIRGPASALYGNAAGGVIQLETAPPPSTPLRQELRAVVGANGLRRFESTTAGQSGAASYLLSLNRLAYDGYREFSTAENLHANARFGYELARGELRFTANFVDYEAQNPGSLSAELLSQDRTQAYANNVRQRTGEQGTQGQLGATWQRELGSGHVELTAYGIARSIDNPIPPVIIVLDRTAAGTRALYRDEVRVGSRGVQWAVGADIETQRDDRRNFANDEGERGALGLDQLETVLSVGSFAQLSVPLTERLNALGGVRYDFFRFEAEDRLVGGDQADESGSRALDAISPSVGLLYDVADALGVYTNVGTSFETPTTTELANRPNGAGGFNPELEPQRTLSFELGAKGRFGQRVGYQVAAYHASIDNSLIPFEVPGAAGRQFFRNAGSSVHRGIEAGASVAILDGLTGQLAYTLTDAYFDEYRTADTVLDGNAVPGVAPHQLEAILSYRGAGWYIDLEGRYASKMAVNDANNAHSPAYTVTDLRAGLTAAEIGGVDVAPFVGLTNVFDEDYNTAVTVNAFGGRYYEPGPGRAVYVGLGVAFGGE